MLLLLARADLLKNYYVDVVFGDEAHNLLGRETSRIWREFTAAKRAIGLTASPEYGPHKKLAQLFDHEIHSSDLRSHVEAGNVSGVQIMGFGTGVELEANTGTDDFSDASLEPLMLDPRRNQAICDVAAQLVAEGRRGVINALPGKHKGQTLFHPRLLAQALDGREIEDDFGNKRQIRAAAIGTHISAKMCEKIQDDFKKGEYDILIQVDKINQSFDCDEIAFIVNAAPTLSPVRGIQRMGRLMRSNKEWPIKIVIEFIDDIKGKRIPYTAWHVLGERSLKQNQIIASADLHKLLDYQLHRKGGTGGTRRRPKIRPISLPDPEAFSDLLKSMHEDYTLRLVDTFTLRAKQGYGLPRQGWRELRTVVQERYQKASLGVDGIRGVLERAGGEAYCEPALGRHGPTYFISPEGERFLTGYEFPESPPSREWKTERELAEILDTTRDIIRRCSDGLARTMYLAHRINREHEHFGPEAIVVLKQRVEKVKQEEKETQSLVAARDLAREPEVDWDRASIHYFLTSHHGVEGRMLKNPGGGPDARFYTQEEADIVRRHRRHSYQVTQRELNGGKVIDLERATGRTRQEILAATAALKLEYRVRDGRYKDKEGRYLYSELTTPWAAKQIAEYLQANPTLPEDAAQKDATIAPEPTITPEQNTEPQALARPETAAADAPERPVQPAFRTPPARPNSPEQPRLGASKVVVEPGGRISIVRVPPAASEQEPPRPRQKQAPAPEPPPKHDPEPVRSDEGQYVDVLDTLESLGAPCDWNAVRRIAHACGLKTSAIKKVDDKLMSTEDTVLTLAAHIAALPEATDSMETPYDLARRLDLQVNDVLEIVSMLGADVQKMTHIMKGPADAQDRPGAAAVYFTAELCSLVERGSRSRRPAPSRGVRSRGRHGKRR